MAEQVQGGAQAAKGKGRGLFSWIMIAVVVLVIIGAGGAAWYFFLGGRAHFVSAAPGTPEPALPFFVEIKPFVVTMVPANGPSHFVQIGLNLKLSGPAASNDVTAVLPELQDAIRETVISFKLEDLQTPTGINKLRQALVARTNAVLRTALGEGRIKRLAGADATGNLVQNVFFTTLVIE